MNDIQTTLNGLNDDELRAVIARAGEMLKERDAARKQAAIEKARATLAAEGLTFHDVTQTGDRGKRKKRPKRRPIYQSGHRYQHPKKPELVWSGNGKKPSWLHKLESTGQRAIELPGDSEQS